jgi:nitrite reductase/ring-hydroxylating ferredoxin subunit
MRPVLRERVAGPIERLRMLDSASEPVKTLVDRFVPVGGTSKELLSGTWLGHPLHPVLTDVVVGAWTSSFLLDLVPGRRTRVASDRLIAAGVLAAVPTAAAGLSDWADVGGGARRVGVVHAAANTVALGLYAGSWAARRRGARLRAWWLSSLGFGTAFFSAYLGGHMVFAQGVGVEQTVFEQGPVDWQPVAAEGELQEGKLTPARADGVALLLVRRGGTVHALADRCTHRGCSLHEGRLADDTVVCPCHGSTYRLEDGGVVHGPATGPQPAYQVRVRDGRVEVRLAPAE